MTDIPNTEEDEFENSLNKKDESLETHKRVTEEGDQSEPIMTQPKVSQFQELPESDDEENNKRKDEDCCFAPYMIDDNDIFFLCRCFAWCCVQIGECTENCCEGCAECINSSCNSQEADNDNDCNECDSCDCSCFD